MGLHLPPIFAAFLTIGFVVFLFRRDIRQRPDITGALWVPLIWMLIIFSRQTSEWLSLFGFHVGAVTLEEGSPLDACVYFGLIAAGLYVLIQRRVQLTKIVLKNQWFTIFLLYCFISIVWSDFPFVAFKRWIKDLGHPIMVLIILTEPDSSESLTRLMKRCAYVVLPVSILFIKYYPEWGRGFDVWSGMAYNTGIASGKNMLGADCLILGLFLFWHLLQTWRSEGSKARRNELLLTGGLLYMIWWLLSRANSATSLLSLLVGVLTIAIVGLRLVNKRLIGTYIVIVIATIAAIESVFGIYDRVLLLVNRDSTLTERTYLWSALFKIEINPLLGTGFESFWLGKRREGLWEQLRWEANEAHNGYLETYLDLGLVGLFLLIGLLFATFRKSRLELLRNFQFGRFRFGFLVAAILYNWTESGFKSLHPVWFVFHFVALDYPLPQPALEPPFQGMKSEGIEPAFANEAA